MIVTRLQAGDYRNIGQLDWAPGEQVNVICGQNAQGKTNLLEALWLFTGGKSFRGSKDHELVAREQACARLRCEFVAEGREQKAELTIVRRRKASLNGVELPSTARLTGHFGAVVFSPDHLLMIKGSPDGRRRFLDAALCQRHPGYVKTYAAYVHVLQQRNALLKEWKRFPDDEQLAAWDARLVQTAVEVVRERQAYTARLQPLVEEIYSGLSGGRETLALAYEPDKQYDQQTPADIAALWQQVLAASRSADIGAGFSTVGPHREDLQVSIGGYSARSFGSQGQQRSTVLALKLAEATLLAQETAETPIILLDDVMSELDETRQDYLMNHLGEWQVFITCCDPAAVGRLAQGHVWQIENGQLKPE